MLILYCAVPGFILVALCYFVPEDLTNILEYGSFSGST